MVFLIIKRLFSITYAMAIAHLGSSINRLWYACQILLRSMLRKGGKRSPGYNIHCNLTVLSHSQNIVWDDLLMRKVKPPFVPTVVSIQTISYISYSIKCCVCLSSS